MGLAVVYCAVNKPILVNIRRFDNIYCAVNKALPLYETMSKRLDFPKRHPAWPGRAVVLRIEPPMASRPFGSHR